MSLSDAELPLGETLAWIVEPGCGAVVTFLGTVRDHAEGRPGVSRLAYEAYAEGARTALSELAAEARRRWPALGRIALHHRVGQLELCDVAVVVVVAAPHRGEAFEAARWCIDTLKATVPIWKYETWRGGEDWSEHATPLGGVGIRAGAAPGRGAEAEVPA